MNDKQKKTVIIVAGVAIVAILLFALLRKKSAAQIVNENTTPGDGQGILSPMSYNIPPLEMQAGGGNNYGGLTFVSAPASAFKCGGNSYYSSPEAQIESADGESALDAADRSVFDLIRWDV